MGQADKHNKKSTQDKQNEYNTSDKQNKLNKHANITKRPTQEIGQIDQIGQTEHIAKGQ